MLIDRYVRPGKANYISFFQENLDKKQSLACIEEKQGIILPVKRLPGDELLFGRGGCINSCHDYIELSGIQGRIEGYYDYKELIIENEDAVYCGYVARHWGHFLIETVPRLWYTLSHVNDNKTFVFITEYDSDYVIEGNVKAFFELLGILNKIKIINKPTQFSRVLIPELSYSRTHFYSDAYNDIIDVVAQSACNRSVKTVDFPDKVYLSRALFAGTGKHKTEYGLEFLDDYFEKNGYKVIYPEKEDLTVLIQYLQNAKICASESGSCAHNLLFSKRNSAVEIIERQPYVNEIQADIDIIRGFHTTYIDAYYALYPVNAAFGPYWLSYTKWFKRFTVDNSYSEPDDKYISSKYHKDAIAWYIDNYHRRYGNSLFIDEMVLEYAKVFYEAISETNIEFEKILVMNNKLSDNPWIRLAFSMKQVIKKVLKGISNY